MSRPLRVLRVIAHLGSGGAERQCVEVLGAMHAARERLGVDVQLATFWDRGHLHGPPVGLTWHRIDQPVSPLGVARGAMSMAALLRRGQYDCVHALLWPAAALVAPLLPRRCALVTSIHSSQIADRRGKAAVLRAIGLRTDLLVFNNHPGVEALRARFGMTAAQTRVRPNGKAPATPPRLDGREGIVCVARDVPSKRQSLLLEAWLRLDPNTRPSLTFVGRGSDQGILGAKIRAAGAKGLGEIEDPGAVLALAAVAALPTDHEGMPNAVLEGWNHGATVIASCVGGVRDLVVDGQDALLVENDAAAWAEGLARLLADHALRERLAARGRERIEQEFSLAETTRAWIELYHEATRVRGHGI